MSNRKKSVNELYEIIDSVYSKLNGKFNKILFEEGDYESKEPALSIKGGICIGKGICIKSEHCNGDGNSPALKVCGGVEIGKQLFVNSINVKKNISTESCSVKRINVSEKINISEGGLEISSVADIDSSLPALLVSGGVCIGKCLEIRNLSDIDSNLTALTVKGGAIIGKSLLVKQSISSQKIICEELILSHIETTNINSKSGNFDTISIDSVSSAENKIPSLFVKGGFRINGQIFIEDEREGSFPALKVRGGIMVNKSARFESVGDCGDTNPAVVVLGGMNIKKGIQTSNIKIEGYADVANNNLLQIINGGADIGGVLRVSSEKDSSPATESAALIVNGGIKCGRNLIVGGSLYLSDSISPDTNGNVMPTLCSSGGISSGLVFRNDPSFGRTVSLVINHKEILSTSRQGINFNAPQLSISQGSKLKFGNLTIFQSNEFMQTIISPKTLKTSWSKLDLENKDVVEIVDFLKNDIVYVYNSILIKNDNKILFSESDTLVSSVLLNIINSSKINTDNNIKYYGTYILEPGIYSVSVVCDLKSKTFELFCSK